ncbi:hypothetical protein [uncultured Paludibaculum sp.]|uniref:hypothetical protein n=1 Tax=uncultured Paludibaculum sp. TaxID=1765020 RepID=UPI002AAC4D07|nr:hypothetical protein [uncultured Paludibaculum sp.]
MPVLCALIVLGLTPVSPAVVVDRPETLVVSNLADSQAERESEQVLTRYLQSSRRNLVRGVSMMAHFAGRLPKMKKSATLDARRRVSKEGTIVYEPTERQGDSTVQKELIVRFINGEMENSAKENTKVAITAENYKFKYKGTRDRDGRPAYVFEINPRKKREGLFKGELWIDADTSLPVREVGRFVKSPSVFLKKVDFTREYTIKEGVAMPQMMEINSQTRFWGMAELAIQYSEFTWEDAHVMAN